MNFTQKYLKYKKKYENLKLKNTMIGGTILDSDIVYQDDLVCILNPKVEKGIIIWSHYNQPPNTINVCTSGLKSGKQLTDEGIDFGRDKIHPYIFFRAPYFSNPINYDSVKSEIVSSFGNELNNEPKVFIRVDPDRTSVFSSEIRVKAPPAFFFKESGHLLTRIEERTTLFDLKMKPTDSRYKELYSQYLENEVKKSQKTLSQYLTIIKKNMKIDSNSYDLYSSYKVLQKFVSHYEDSFNPFNEPSEEDTLVLLDSTPIEKNSEILVSMAVLPKEYFVLCTQDR